jgi:hypothetical protein
MTRLRLAVLATMFGYAILSGFAQTTQPAPNQGSSGTAQSAPGGGEPYTIFPAKPPRFQIPSRKPSKDFQLQGQLPRYLGQLPRYQETPPRGDFDRGIYVRKPAARDESCASIISYNFSVGENPQLESVTTCTSASTTNSLRTRGKDKKPPAPLFKTTDLKTVPPQ